MEETRVKIEIILSDGSFTMRTEIDKELNPLELLGLGEITKNHLGHSLKVNPKLKLSKSIEKDHSDAIEVEKNPPPPLEDILQQMFGEKGGDNCQCVVCKVRRGEVDPFNFTPEQEEEIKNLSIKKGVSVEKIKSDCEKFYTMRTLDVKPGLMGTGGEA